MKISAKSQISSAHIIFLLCIRAPVDFIPVPTVGAFVLYFYDPVQKQYRFHFFSFCISNTYLSQYQKPDKNVII